MSRNYKIHPDVPKYARCPSCARLVRQPESLPYCGEECRIRALPSYLRPKEKPSTKSIPTIDRAIQCDPTPLPDWVKTEGDADDF